MNGYVFVLLLTFAAFHQGTALQCWRCSSDILRSCSDPFNTSDILALRNGGSVYNNLQQNYNQRQFDSSNPNYNPNYNSNNNPNYNPNNNPNYNPSYNPNYNGNFRPSNFGGSRDLPVLETCDENEARIRRMRPVCMKEILRGTSYTSVIRRCSMIPLEQYVGTCQRPTAGGLSLDFCQTCEYDGCNSATGLRTSLFVAILLVLGAHMCMHL